MSEKKLEKTSKQGGSKKTQPQLPVAIQGYEGSFHQVAARSFYGKNVQILPCATFTEVIKQASDKKTTMGGIMAIENSIAGSILPNYNLLQKSDLFVAGEVYLQIDQHLMVNPGVKLTDIKEVHSHPMALQQCLGFLNPKGWKLIETEDTALSAKHVHLRKSKHVAAIAGKLAAELFGLDIIAPKIHDVKNNYTRFLILQQSPSEVEGANKASINFHTDHAKGRLSEVLTLIAKEGINLSKLQSFPIAGSKFKYGFHADLEFEAIGQYKKLIGKLEKKTEYLRVLGVYKKGKFNK
ncbi:MAG: prephenate dehydratase [Chitinophagaceae bacterium]|nr:prephenate dehydratase [Chitinophagaceae bacterium]